jgi:hypothetical protein
MRASNRGAGYIVPPRPYAGEAAIPALRRFRERIDAARQAHGNDYFAACEPAFKELLSVGFLRDYVGYELAQIAADPLHETAGGATASAVNIILTRDWTLSVRLVTPRCQRAGIAWSEAEHVMIGVVEVPRSAPLTYQHLEQPCPEPNEVFDPSRVLVARGYRTLAPGETAIFRAGRDLLDITSAAEPSVVLVFTSATVLPFRWEYDLATRKPVRQVAAYVVAARIDIAMRLLAASGDPSAVPFLVPVADHEDHFLRWNAVRSVMALDPETGMRLLRSAADDRHSHVRDAARRSLAALERAATEGAPA